MERYINQEDHSQSAYLRDLTASLWRDWGYGGFIQEYFDGCDRGTFDEEPFPAQSILRSLCEFIIDHWTAYEEDEVDLAARQRAFQADAPSNPDATSHPEKLPIEWAMDSRNVEYYSFVEELRDKGKTFADATADDLYEYYRELRISGGLVFAEIVAGECFEQLLSDRELVKSVNEQIASALLEEDPPESGEVAAAPAGVGLRAIPAWAQKLILARDGRKCDGCQKAGTPEGAPATGEPVGMGGFVLGYWVPPGLGGIPDVVNLRVLCPGCAGAEPAGASR